MEKQTNKTGNKPVTKPVEPQTAPEETQAVSPVEPQTPPEETQASPPVKESTPPAVKTTGNKRQKTASEIMQKHNVEEVYCVNGYFFTKKENAEAALRNYPESELETFK
jgi:hypothetical protein